MFETVDRGSWVVDYRASAHRSMISAVDERNIWVATDTGMILKLSPSK